MGYFRKRQPRSSAKWNHSARHLLIRPALQSHIPGVPRCALPLLPPLQPPELTCLMFRVPSPIQQGASRLEAHAAVFRGETPKPAEARKTKATQRVRQAAENTFSSPFFLWSVATRTLPKTTSSFSSFASQPMKSRAQGSGDRLALISNWVSETS